jgi:hypothetical protein
MAGATAASGAPTRAMPPEAKGQPRVGDPHISLVGQQKVAAFTSALGPVASAIPLEQSAVTTYSST